MDAYMGIVVVQSLRDPAITKGFKIASVKQGKSWTFLLDTVPGDDFAQHVSLVQSNLIADGRWYVHYFRGNELVVVFHDAVFYISTDPVSWGPAIQHGLDLGIPHEQLDFQPRTRSDIERFFGMTLV